MEFSKGLAGVIADETAISNVEGDIGRLTYRGYAIEDLVTLDYAAVMWLVLTGELPDADEQKSLEVFLSTHGPLHAREIDVLAAIPDSIHPMRVLQAMVPVIQVPEDAVLEPLSREGAAGLVLIARLPALIASRHCLTRGEALPTFDPDQPWLANFLRMFTGKEPSRAHLEALRIVQILQMEHSFNAGTFTARVVASTLAPVASVFSAALGALHGVLHGGADEAALNDAKSVGGAQHAAVWVDDLLARKGKLMGMGHREYRKVDPRAVILKPMARSLCEGTPEEDVFDTLEALETAFNARMQEKGKDVWANLEFYKGPVYESMGIPANYFTAVFAMSRAAGWLAHFLESRADNRIMRPKAAYIGPEYRPLSRP